MITVVEDDPDLTQYEGFDPERAPKDTPKVKWIDHLLGVFCVERPRTIRLPEGKKIYDGGELMVTTVLSSDAHGCNV